MPRGGGGIPAAALTERTLSPRGAPLPRGAPCRFACEVLNKRNNSGSSARLGRIEVQRLRWRWGAAVRSASCGDVSRNGGRERGKDGAGAITEDVDQE